jgi:hypothetical protein
MRSGNVNEGSPNANEANEALRDLAETEESSLGAIQVRCGTCDQIFEVAAELAGLSEFCPACGALTDIPSENPGEIPRDIPGPDGSDNVSPPPDESAPPNTDSSVEVQSSSSQEPPILTPGLSPIYTEPHDPVRGLPAFLWWILALAAVGGFTAACFYLLSDTWETRHVQELTDDVNRADALFSAEDMSGAAREYQAVLVAAGARDIQSNYIRHLLDRSHEGVSEAQRRLRLAQAPPKQIAATSPAELASTQPASPAGDLGTIFLEAGDRFPHAAWANPELYRDENQNWRRRQFVIWNVSCRLQPGADPPRAVVDYVCEARVSMPHSNADGAQEDTDLINKEWRSPIHRIATFQLMSGKWRELGVTDQFLNGATGGIAEHSESLTALRDLESHVFSGESN